MGITIFAAILLALAALIALFARHRLADAAIFAAAGAVIAIPVPLLLGGLLVALFLGTLLGRVTATPLRTRPPGQTVVLYDGNCRFCTGQMKNLVRLARPDALSPRNFQEPGALDPFPGVTYDACMQAMQLVTPDGRVYSAFEAAVRAVATRPIGRIAYAYYIPGLRILFDAAYAIIAAQRYRIAGRAVAAGECDESCAVHFRH